MPILWSGITRDGTVLAEAGQDDRGGAVLALAQKVLKKKPTPGWEFASAKGLKAIKFHVYEGGSARAEKPTVWSAACVYDPALEELQARGFLEKIVLLSEPLRSTPLWQTGATLACQESFAPTLLQRMEQVAAMGRMAMVSTKVDEVKTLMGENIELLLAQGDKLEDLDERASHLSKLSATFKKGTTSLRRRYMWNNARMGLAAGTAVTVGVGVIVVPPLVALL